MDEERIQELEKQRGRPYPPAVREAMLSDVHFTQRTPTEMREIRARGFRAMAELGRSKRDLRKRAEFIMNTALTGKTADRVREMFPELGEDIRFMDAALIGLLSKLPKGDTAAWGAAIKLLGLDKDQAEKHGGGTGGIQISFVNPPTAPTPSIQNAEAQAVPNIIPVFDAEASTANNNSEDRKE